MKKLIVLLTLAVSGAMAQPGFKHAPQAPVMPMVQSYMPSMQHVAPVHYYPQPQPMYHMQPMQHPMEQAPVMPMVQYYMPSVQQPMIHHVEPPMMPVQAPAPVIQYVSKAHPSEPTAKESSVKESASAEISTEVSNEDMPKLFDAALRHHRTKLDPKDGEKIESDTVRKIAEQENEYQYSVERTRQIFLKLRSLMQRTLETVNESLRSFNDMML